MSVEPGHTTKRLQQCLDRLRAGDGNGQDELIQHAYKRLELLARGMRSGYPAVHRLEETGDVLHRALIRLTRALSAVRPESLEGFFRLAAVQIRRELIDLHRHHFGPHGEAARQVSNTPPSNDSGSNVGPLEPGPGPRSWLQRQEVQALVHECVEQLSEAERQIVDLRFYSGLTEEEAAEIVGVSVPTVKRRWRTARVELGRLLRTRGVSA